MNNGEKAIDIEEVDNRKREYLKKLELYTRSNNADKKKLKDLILRIKGPLGLEKFGKLVGTSAANLSRILNGNLETSLRNSLIAGLASAADLNPSCGVTFDDLTNANGMRSIADVDINARQTAYEGNASIALISGILLSGYSVKILSMDGKSLKCTLPQQMDDSSKLLLGLIEKEDMPQMIIRTDEVHNKVSEQGTWGFYFNFSTSGDHSTASSLVNRALACFYKSQNTINKISIVTNNIELWNWMIEMMDDQRIDNQLTFIFTDNRGSRLIDERVVESTVTQPDALFHAAKLSDTD